jgi:hypothetical protein
MALVIERVSDAAALALASGFGAIALVCILAVKPA